MTLCEIRFGPMAEALLLLPKKMTTPSAEVQLLATHLQEAPNGEQCQLPARPGKSGPARGIFQFERDGGVAGVLQHPQSRPHVLEVCRALGVQATVQGIYDALPSTNDVLDCALARLLYWTDPAPLPEVGDVEGAWRYYLHNWRPGAFTRGTDRQRVELRKKWSLNYVRALEAAL